MKNRESRHIMASSVMTKKSSGPGKAEGQSDAVKALRIQAEEAILANRDSDYPPPGEEGRILHDLRMNQAELEMQNEELGQTREYLDIARVKYFGLYNLAPVGYFTLGEQNVVLEANITSANLLGMEKTLMIGQAFTRLIATEDQDIYNLLHKKLHGKGTPQTCELRMSRPDGVLFWVRLDASVAIDAENGATVCHAVITDITERKVADEKVMEAKEAAERATKIKDKFVSLVAHDLKSPLGGIINFMQLLRKDEADDNAKMILDASINSAKQMVNLIDDVLNLSRLETGQLKLDMQFFDMKYLGAKMCVDFTSIAEQKGIKLTCVIPDNSRVYGDKTFLGEALQNLITNAIKFCRKGDAITISLSETEKTAIQVRDTGPGMKPELLNKLFKFNSVVTSVGTAGETGTGLGLPLVKDILQLHGGDLVVTSEMGKGSTFTLKLPYVRPRILIVDDEPLFRLLFRTTLSKVEADISEAEDGAAALDMLAVGKVLPHLIISDIEMPNMTGLELLAHLHDRHETQSIPVIVISGKHGMEVRDTVYQLGGKDFLTKQLDADDFITRVRRFIS